MGNAESTAYVTAIAAKYGFQPTDLLIHWAGGSRGMVCSITTADGSHTASVTIVRRRADDVMAMQVESALCDLWRQSSRP
jgi:hypothetical protein